MAPIRSIQTRGTKPPVGHYSQAIQHDGLVYVSGQLPMNLETGQLVPGTVEAQTELTLSNLRRILEAAGSGLDRVLQVTIYVPSIDHWPAVNATYARVLGAHRPARAVVPVPVLHGDAAVEVQAIAAMAPKRRAARVTRSARSRPRRKAARRTAR